MPTISFNITDKKYALAANAVSAFNRMHPEANVTTIDSFAKQSFLTLYKAYLGHYQNLRAQDIMEKINTCSNETWNQITGLLAADTQVDDGG